jgi:hypothetical protein
MWPGDPLPGAGRPTLDRLLDGHEGNGIQADHPANPRTAWRRAGRLAPESPCRAGLPVSVSDENHRQTELARPTHQVPNQAVMLTPMTLGVLQTSLRLATPGHPS